MKISRIEIENYRSINRLDVKIDKFTAFIGVNGSGKSTILYAIRWLLDGGQLEIEDIHGYKEDDPTTYTNKQISVKITFDTITDVDKESLIKSSNVQTLLHQNDHSNNTKNQVLPKVDVMMRRAVAMMTIRKNDGDRSKANYLTDYVKTFKVKDMYRI